MKKTSIYKLIFDYHANMIECCSIRQCLGLISDEKADAIKKKHVMACLKSAYFGGFANDEVKKLFE